MFVVCRLDGNKLVTVHLPSLATHPSLQVPAEFYLAANPLLCDCHMDYLARMWELTQTGENLEQKNPVTHHDCVLCRCCVCPRNNIFP